MHNKIIPVFIPHASCPRQCIFCNQKKTTGVNGYDLEYVTETIEKCIASMGGGGGAVVREIAFYGGSFTAIDPHRQLELLKIAKRYIDTGQVDTIRVSTRPDCIDDDILKRLKDHGVTLIELGVQSMDDEVLRANRRGHTRNDTVAASMMIKRAGFGLCHQLMPGLYRDSMGAMLKTVDESIKLAPDFMRVYPCLVIKGTALQKLYFDGDYKPLSLTEAVDISKVIYLKAMAAGINIIRMGIHPARDLVENGIVAGPFHPAFKHLVISSLFYDICDKMIQRTSFRGGVTFYVNKSDVSNLIGMNKNNIRRLKAKYSLDEVKVVHDGSIGKGNIAIEHIGEKVVASIFEPPAALVTGEKC